MELIILLPQPPENVFAGKTTMSDYGIDDINLSQQLYGHVFNFGLCIYFGF